MKNPKQTHIRPLYTNNTSYERKTGVWRLSFLIGRNLATQSQIQDSGIDAVRDFKIYRTARVYSSKWSEIASASHRWMSKNKGA